MLRKLLLPACMASVVGISAVAAQPDADHATPGQKTNHVSIETPAGGEPMIVVRYPWKTHKKPSVEIRSYIQGEEDSPRVRPLHFRHGFIKDEVTIAVYETEAASDLTRTVAEFSRRDIDFTAVGNRNLFNRPAVCITCETPVLRPNKEPFPEKSRRAIFPFLEPWAADDRTLFLSPPEPLFTGPAKIRVFFLRDDRVVWSETVEWPGLSKPEATAARTTP
jgi:hypothetical protein